MIFYSYFTVQILVFIAALIGPRVRLKTSGANETHNPFSGVWIRKPDHESMQGQSWLGVLKQALNEFRIMWLGANKLSLTVPIIALSMAPPNLVGAILTNLASPIVLLLMHIVIRKSTDGMDAFGTNREITEGLKTNPNYFEEEVIRFAGEGATEAEIAKARRTLKSWCWFAKLFGFLGYRVKFMIAPELRVFLGGGQ